MCLRDVYFPILPNRPYSPAFVATSRESVWHPQNLFEKDLKSTIGKRAYSSCLAHGTIPTKKKHEI